MFYKPVLFYYIVACKGNLHESEKFFFYVFSHGKEHLDQKSISFLLEHIFIGCFSGLVDVIYVAAMFALVVGSELHENAKVHRENPIITSLVSAAVCIN